MLIVEWSGHAKNGSDIIGKFSWNKLDHFNETYMKMELIVLAINFWIYFV